MSITINEVINKLKNEKYISISLIQREMGVGFILANKLFKELEENGYLVKNQQNGRCLFSREKLKEYGVITKEGIKLLFLDVDGVLNCHSTKDCCGPYRGIEDKKVALVKEIVDATGAKIVLVSSWKEWWYKEPHFKDKQDDLATYLDEKLAKQGLTIIDKTDDYNSFNRGEGIHEYIRRLKRRDVIVDDYVVLDDEMFDYKERKITKHLIQTSYYSHGLDKKHVAKAIKILNKEQI